MKLNYKKFGEGKTLVILHGLFGSLDNWQTIARRFGENGYCVYTIDQRNHGKSPHTDEFSMDLMVGDLLEFFQEKHLKDVHLLGHSMGGKVAMNMTMKHPEFIDQLAIVDLAPKKYARGHDEIFRALRSLKLNKITRRQEAEELLHDKIPDLETLQFILKSLERTKEGKYQWKFNLESLYQNYDEIVAEVPFHLAFNNPVLFLRGARSSYILDEDWEQILTYFSSAELVTVPHAGHWIHAEQPERFFEEVCRFLVEGAKV